MSRWWFWLRVLCNYVRKLQVFHRVRLWNGEVEIQEDTGDEVKIGRIRREWKCDFIDLSSRGNLLFETKHNNIWRGRRIR